MVYVLIWRRVYGLYIHVRSRVSGLCFMVSGFGFRVHGFGFRVSGFGFGKEQTVIEKGGAPVVLMGLSSASSLHMLLERQTKEKMRRRQAKERAASKPRSVSA